MARRKKAPKPPKPPKPQKPQTIGFEDLPPELRNKVYHFAFVEDGPVFIKLEMFGYQPVPRFNVRGSISPVSPETRLIDFPVAFLVTNKALHEEASAVFYGANDFTYTMWSFQVCLREGARINIRHMRNVKLVEFKDMPGKDFAYITGPFTRAVESSNSPMALQRLEIAEESWLTPNVVVRLHGMLRAFKNLKPDVTVEESGVLDIVHFMSADGWRESKAFTLEMRGQVKELLEAEESEKISRKSQAKKRGKKARK